MEYIKKEWKSIAAAVLVVVASIGMLYYSKDAVVSEVVGENVPVIDPHKAIIAAIIRMFVGLGIYLLRRKSYPAE